MKSVNTNSSSEKNKNYYPDEAKSSYALQSSSSKSKAASFDFPEIQDIQGDLVALKNDIAKLSQHVYEDGGKQIKEFANTKLEALSEQIQKRPAQALAVAFFSGVVLSFLCARR